jgi:hypothetical protein
MISRSTRTMLVTIAIAAVLPVAASAAGCPLDSFGARKLHTCGDDRCGSFTPPPEIAAIKRGLYGEMVGLFINDGLAEWIGVDLDAGEIVRVERYAGPHLGGAPRAATPSAQLSRRETGQGRHRVIDIIRRAPLARDTAEDIVCAANAVWTDDDRPPMSSISDMHLGVVLVDGAARRAEGGPAGMTAAVRALHYRLEALKGRPAPVEVPLPPRQE